MSFAFGPPRATRRPSLTPMIDVVFLLLIFFMLAARFGLPAIVPLPVAGGTAIWEGPPRLLEVRTEGLYLNGVPVPGVEALRPLMPRPDAPVFVRAPGGTVQDVVTLLDALRDAGLGTPVVVE